MKLDIRRKVLLLVLSGSLLTFLLVTVFLSFGLYHARATFDKKNEELGEEVAGYAEDLVETQIKKRMEEVTRFRAQHIEHGLMGTAANVQYLAGTMNAFF